MFRPLEDLIPWIDLISEYLDHSSEIKNPAKNPKRILDVVKITLIISELISGKVKYDFKNQIRVNVTKIEIIDFQFFIDSYGLIN
jgi:hypothetical protein